MQQLAYAAAEKWEIVMIDLRLIDESACDKVQNLAIHLAIERKQLDILNSLQVRRERRVETSTGGASSEEKECPQTKLFFLLFLLWAYTQLARPIIEC